MERQYHIEADSASPVPKNLWSVEPARRGDRRLDHWLRPRSPFTLLHRETALM